MALERMPVTNHERWGNLIKTWSTGKNYLDDENEYPIPTTIDEFKEQLVKAQAPLSAHAIRPFLPGQLQFNERWIVWNSSPIAREQFRFDHNDRFEQFRASFDCGCK
jgi:hypothetical protein